MTEPASIRTNNPGAMWGGSHANKWGATDDLVLKDGQSNHIAVFPTKVMGAAAQLDLWRVAYSGKTLARDIDKWSGHNSPKGYVAALQKEAGIGPNEIITPALLAGPKGLALIKAQARWESGRPYPMTDAEWEEAQRLVFPPKSASHPAELPIGTAVAAGSAAIGVQAGWPWWAVVAGVIVAAIAVVAVIRYFHKKG